MRKICPAAIQYIGELYVAGTLSGCSDGQLLERFIATDGEKDRTKAELAFACLLERHGGMVWNVCRSFAVDDHDAEDAFQATFLVLVRKAPSLRVRQTLGPWLYAVAHRVGMSTRTASARRRAVERTAWNRALKDGWSRPSERLSEMEELVGLLHQEIVLLPERLREAVVLCDLEGLSYLKAAAQLNVPLGTLQSRLSRARRRLRARLVQQGAGAFESDERAGSASAWIAGIAGRLSPPRLLAESVYRQCLVVLAEPAKLRMIVSSSVQELIKKGLGPTLLSWCGGVALIPITVVILCGAILLGSQTSAQPRQEEKRSAKEAAPGTKPVKSDSFLARSKPLVVPALREPRATAGRGKALVYALDENGNRIEMPPVPSKRRQRGGEGLERPSKEVSIDLSWAVVTAVFDHHLLAQQTFPNGGAFRSIRPEHLYRRVDLERQERSRNGDWSDWRPVDPAPTLRVLDNVPEVDEERTPDEIRSLPLIDPLPFLKEGVWTGVDVERFVPKVRENNPDQPVGHVGRFEKTKRATTPPVLMVRQFDFSVAPGATYRYRARLAVDDTRWRRREVSGAWSEPTEAVTIPSASGENRSIREG